MIIGNLMTEEQMFIISIFTRDSNDDIWKIDIA